MILLSITLYALGLISGFLLSAYKSSQGEAIQHDYIVELVEDNRKLKNLLKVEIAKPAKKKPKKKVAKKKTAKKVL